MRVSSLAIAVKELPGRISPPIVLAPANNAGDYILKSSRGEAVVGAVEKMGIAAVADVLFVTTPVRVENRLGHSIEVLYVADEKVQGTVFVLDPGDEMSVPMRHLQTASSTADSSRGLSFRPLPLQHKRRYNRTLSSSSRRAHRYSSVGSIGSTSSDGVQWKRSPVVVNLDGGHNLSFPAETREQDKLGLDKEGGLMESLRVKSLVEQEWEDEVDYKNVFNFETTLLVQANSLRPFQFKQVLTVQILSASDLRASDLGRTSDPYVSVRVGKERFQTPTIEKELDPVWASGATFRFGENVKLDTSGEILIKVWDDDLTANDILGYKTLSIAEVIEAISDEDERGKNIVELAESDGSMDNCIVRKYALEAGEGLSERKVQGSIEILLAYDVYSVATQTPKDGIQHVLSLYPAYILDNLLPVDAEIRFTWDEHTWQYIVPSGCDLSFTDLDGSLLDFLLPASLRSPSKSKSKRRVSTSPGLTVQIRVKDGEALSAWSDPLSAANEAVPLHHAHDTNRSEALLAVAAVECVRNVREDGGARRLVLYAPFWVMNKTDINLVYRSGQIRVSQQSSFASNEEHVLPIVLPDNTLRLEAAKVVNLESPLRGKKPFSLEDEEDIEQSPYVLLGPDTEGRDGNTNPYSTRSANSSVVLAVGVSKYLLNGDSANSSINEGSRLDFSIAVRGREEQDAVISRAVGHVQEEGLAEWKASSVVVTVDSTLAEATLVVSVLDDEKRKPVAPPLSVPLAGLTFNDAQASVHAKASGGERGHEIWLTLTEIARRPARREVAVEMVPLNGKQVRTQLIRLTPKFELANVMQYGVFMKQYGAQAVSAVYLPPKPQSPPEEEIDVETSRNYDAKVVPFYLGGAIDGIEDDFAAYVQLRVDLPGAMWSEPFPLESHDDFPLQLRNGKGQRALKTWVDMNQRGPTKFIVLRPLSFEASVLMVQNKSSHKLWLAQVYKHKQSISEKLSLIASSAKYKVTADDLKYTPDMILPGSEFALALDYPEVNTGGNEGEIETLRVILMPARKNGDAYDIEKGIEVRYALGFRSQYVLSGETIEVTVKAVGSKIALVIQPLDKSRSKSRKKQASAARVDRLSQLSPKRPGMDLVCHLSSVGISLFSTYKSVEVAFIALQRIHIEQANEYVDGDQGKVLRTYSEYSIGHFQIDSSQPNATYKHFLASRYADFKYRKNNTEDLPVLSSVSEWSKQKVYLLSDELRTTRAKKDFLRIQQVQSSQDGDGGFEVINYMDVGIKPFEIQLDAVFLSGLLGVFSPLLGSKQTGANEIEGEILTTDDPEKLAKRGLWIKELVHSVQYPALVPEQDTVFIEKAMVSKNFINLTVKLNTGELSEQLKTYGISVNRFILAIAFRLSRLDNFKFDLPAGDYQCIFLNKVQEKHTSRIISALLHQLVEVAVNFANRLNPFLKTKAVSPIREKQVPHQGILSAYGPGAHPNAREKHLEEKAVIRIENWYMRIKYFQELSNDPDASRTNTTADKGGRCMDNFAGKCAPCGAGKCRIA